MRWTRTHCARMTVVLGASGFLLIGCANPLADSSHAPRSSVLRAGDRFLLYAPHQPEIWHLADVRDDGLTQLPYVGNQYLLGMSEEDATAVLNEEFRRHFDGIEVRVHRIASTRQD